MKKMFKSKLLFIELILIATGSFFINIDLVGQTTPQPSQTLQDIGNKQYVQVKLKNGETMVFEYQSFMEMNLALQPDETASAPTPPSISAMRFSNTSVVGFMMRV